MRLADVAGMTCLTAREQLNGRRFEPQRRRRQIGRSGQSGRGARGARAQAREALRFAEALGLKDSERLSWDYLLKDQGAPPGKKRRAAA